MAHDPLVHIRTYLLSRSTLTARVGSRIYIGTELPREYRPENGEALVFNGRGGDKHYSNQILIPSIQFMCYSTTEAKAGDLSAVLRGAIDQQRGMGVYSIETSIPYTRRDATTGWPFAFVYYDIHVRNQG
jgi:hypothetical protein